MAFLYTESVGGNIRLAYIFDREWFSFGFGEIIEN